MKIAIIGAPGSGKTELVKLIGPQLGATWITLDEYAEKACDDIDYAPGTDGGYIANLAVALKRLGMERVADLDEFAFQYRITCGTLLETSVYSAMDFEITSKYQEEDEIVNNTRRVEAVLKTLACLYADSFDYDLVFYLPARSEEWKEFDKNLQTAFAAFFLVKTVPLLEDTMEENADIALKIIKKEIDIDEYLRRDAPTTT